MKLYTAEIRKLFSSKILLGLLFALLAVNFALTLYTSQPSPWEPTVREVYAEYLENPDEIDSYYKELLNIEKAAGKEEPAFPYTYSGNEKYDDFNILRLVYERSAYFDGYKSSIEKIIKTTETKIADLHNYGYSDHTYTTKSQIYLKTQYETLLKTIDLHNEYARGYDTYLENHIVCAFILLFLTAAVSYIFLIDSSVGFHDILQVSKKGRSPTAAAKLFTALLTSVFVTVLFLSATFLAVGIAEGFSSPLSPIQVFEDFSTVPDTFTVLGYLLLHTGLRLCAFAVYSLLIAALASARLPYIVCFGGGIAFAGANCFLFYRTYYGTVPAIRYLNFASMTEGRALTDFCRTVSFFKIPVRTSTALIAVSGLVCIVFALLTAFLSSKNVRLFSSFGSLLTRNFGDFWSFFKKIFAGKEKRKIRAPQKPLWFFELCKIHPILTAVLILLILFGRGYYVSKTVGDMKHYDEALYYRYISKITDLAPDARQEYLTEERTRIDEIISRYGANASAFDSGEMTGEDYSAYLKTYYKAKTEDVIFKRAEDYAAYVEIKNEATGFNGNLIYSTGWEKFFGLSPDLFLYIALIILCFRTFSVEYAGNTSSGGFSQILRTTKKGRRHTFRVKLATYLVGAALLAAVFRLTGLYVVGINYTLTNLGATLYSVESFSAVSSGITIGQYLILDIFIQIFASVILSAVICFLSFFCKKAFSILTVTLLLTGVPELIAETVLKSFTDFSILSLTSPQGIFCNSFEKALFHSGLSYLTLVCVFYLVLTTSLLLAASAKYNGFHALKITNKS
jgi:hypothetical protein